MNLLPKWLRWSTSDNWLRALVDKGEIRVFSPDVPFDKDYQVQRDAINLRLHPLAMRLKGELREVDPQAGFPQISQYFEPCPIPAGGLRLKPGELVFCRTLEAVEIRTNRYVGLVIGRRNIAGFGLSIFCDQLKFASGLLWSFPLQVQNRTDKIVKLYPYMYIAQLIIIEYVSPGDRSYRGNYRSCFENYVPLLDESEQRRISQAIELMRGREPGQVNNRQRFDEEIQKLDQEEKKRKEAARLYIRRAGLSPALSAASKISAGITGGLLLLYFFSPQTGVQGKLIISMVAVTLTAHLLDRYAS